MTGMHDAINATGLRRSRVAAQGDVEWPIQELELIMPIT